VNGCSDHGCEWREERTKPWPRSMQRAIALASMLTGLFVLGTPACRRAATSEAKVDLGTIRSHPLGSSELHVLLDGCAYGGMSIIHGATFVHAIKTDAVNPVPFALHVLASGEIDIKSSGFGDNVSGTFGLSAWLRSRRKADPPEFGFQRWSGSKWIEDPSIPSTVLGWMPWRDQALIRIERIEPHGTRVSTEAGDSIPPGFTAPPELAHIDIDGWASLPSAQTLVIKGALNGQAGYTLVAGATTGFFSNEVGGSEQAVSRSCKRILISQWIPKPGLPAVRAVRVLNGKISPGEELPEQPAHLAIDPRCHEWMVSPEGALYEHEALSAPWRRIALLGEQDAPPFPGLAVLGDDVWVSAGSSLYVVRLGAPRKVALPASLRPANYSYWLTPDEENDRLWVVAIPINENRATILTTGPVARSWHCEELPWEPQLAQ